MAPSRSRRPATGATDLPPRARDTAAAASEPRLIKKYSNRKLYDTRSRRYITLERIGELVRGGENVHVVDRGSGEDLTSVTLSQIVLDTQRRRHGAVPEKVLQQLVRAPTEALREAVRQSVSAGQDLMAQAEDRLVRAPERAIEDAIDRALRGLKIPSQKEFDRLERQVRELVKKVDALKSGTPRARTPKSKAR